MEDGSLEHSLIYRSLPPPTQSEVKANAMHVWVPEREDRLPDAITVLQYLQYYSIHYSLHCISIDVYKAIA